jgi:NAD dependent epimerase/dehydratase family enzyme
MSRLVRLTKWGLGGTVGSGEQWISWLHQHDLNRMIVAAIEDAAYEGVYLATSPEPVTNRRFMSALRHACKRPWSPPAPGWAVRLASRWWLKTDPELALKGRRCVPRRLVAERGFEFMFPELGPALHDLMDRRGSK